MVNGKYIFRLEVVRCFTLGLDQECLFNASGLVTFPYEESAPLHQAQPIPRALGPARNNHIHTKISALDDSPQGNFVSSLENAQICSE